MVQSESSPSLAHVLVRKPRETFVRHFARDETLAATASFFVSFDDSTALDRSDEARKGSPRVLLGTQLKVACLLRKQDVSSDCKPTTRNLCASCSLPDANPRHL